MRSSVLRKVEDNFIPDTFTNTPEFLRLKHHQQDIKNILIRDLFKKDPSRFKNFHLKEKGFLLDYSKNHVNGKTMNLLFSLARAENVEEWRDKMFSGNRINISEDRSVLHAALRGSVEKHVEIDGENVQQFVSETLERIKIFSAIVREEKKITDIVHIGIGGSDLGPRLAYEALSQHTDEPRIHFVSNIDGHVMSSVLKKVQPAATLFVVVSKTFTTLETISNAQIAKKWITETLGEEAVLDHFCAVTMNIAAAEDFGIRVQNIFPLRNWIGGRYSVWSAVGITLTLALGFQKFENFLKGGRIMDQHFRDAPLEKNIPVTAALLDIWYRNIWNFPVYAVLPYVEKLKLLPSYLQQLCMESNGKSISRDNKALDYPTNPIIFGAAGTDAQHSFMQLLHQSQTIIPCDFIFVKKCEDPDLSYSKINVNAIAQSCALMQGCMFPDEPHRNCPGNRPSSTIILDRLDAHHLGMLLAFYEHRTFVQGVLWNINSFDQWGVELGKTLARRISQKENIEELDSSTKELMHYIGL